MSESPEHIELVHSIDAWVSESYKERDWLCSYLDLGGREKPEKIGRYKPDVLVRDLPHESLTIVGEAKTYSDVDNAHTRNQIRAYLAYLARQPEPTLVTATPLGARPVMVQIVSRLVEELELSDVRRVYLASGIRPLVHP